MMNDLISRQELYEILDEYDEGKIYWGEAEDRIGNLPSAEPVRQKGEWLEVEEWTGDVYYDCSVCGNSWTTIDGTPWDNGMKFCPHCGAEMKGE